MKLWKTYIWREYSFSTLKCFEYVGNGPLENAQLKM